MRSGNFGCLLRSATVDFTRTISVLSQKIYYGHPTKTTVCKGWLDKPPVPGNRFGTLYVTGTIKVGDEKTNFQLIKVDPSPIVREELWLRVVLSATESDQPFDLHYYEELEQENYYQRVAIYSSEKRIAEIPEIEKVH
jgi:hypothetical protein